MSDETNEILKRLDDALGTTEPTCATCPYWDPIAKKGLCRRHAPRAAFYAEDKQEIGSGASDTELPVWPVVSANSWCGEHPELANRRLQHVQVTDRVTYSCDGASIERPTALVIMCRNPNCGIVIPWKTYEEIGACPVCKAIPTVAEVFDAADPSLWKRPDDPAPTEKDDGSPGGKELIEVLAAPSVYTGLSVVWRGGVIGTVVAVETREQGIVATLEIKAGCDPSLNELILRGADGKKWGVGANMYDLRLRNEALGLGRVDKDHEHG